MTIGTAIIERALQKIGVHSKFSPASPESFVLGMENLNSMLELWLSKNIQIGFTPLEAPGDELNEPPDATNAIVNKLAIQLAPDFDNGVEIVSSSLARNANVQMIEIKRIYQKLTVPCKVVSSTLPTGQGNQRWGWRRTYFPKGGTVDG